MVGIFEKLDNFNIMDVSDAIDAALGIKGTLGYATIALTLLAGYAVKTIMLYKPDLSGPDNGAAYNLDKEQDDDDKEPPRNFTQKQLREFDGTPDKDGNDKPVYLSVNGIVFDMSKGRNFYGPGGPYEKFAGRECGVALAKMSFDEAHLDNMAGCLMLNHGERTELENWIEKFQYYRNYPVMGRFVPFLPEKTEWTIEEMAKANSETPEGYASAPIYVAAKGKVYDMSFGGVTFYGKGGPYSKFAGRDASRALAKMSLDEADLDNPHIDDLTEKDIKILDDWVKKFEEVKGYPVVGKLRK